LSTTKGNDESLHQVPYILYADDDMDDQAFIAEMMRKVRPGIAIKCFMNGLELVQFLEQMPDRSLLPACIVLDLNMPVWDGMHTLKVLKQHKVYQSIPAFIFSTSSSERDMVLAESLGAVAYITKPYGQQELFSVCQEFAEYCDLEQRQKRYAVRQ
jgi:CheY-like chemotaxis protein